MYDEVDDSVGKLVKKSSQGRRIVKKSEKPQRPKKLQRLSVWRNIYRSTNPLSIKYEELELPLEFKQFFKLFLLSPGTLLIPHLERLPMR